MVKNTHKFRIRVTPEMGGVRILYLGHNFK